MLPKEVTSVKRELPPGIVWAIIGVVVVVVVLIGYRVLGPRGSKADTTGSEETIKRVKETGVFYQPPAGAPVPGAGGVRPEPYGGVGGGGAPMPMMGGPPGGTAPTGPPLPGGGN